MDFTANNSITNEVAKVSISKDLLTAYITFTQAFGGYLLTYDNILSILEKSRIAYGIDHDLLKQYSNNPAKPYDSPIEVAKGIPPENGKDASMKFHFNLVRDKSPKILPNGDVDHRALNYIENVRKGDLLATLTRETKGKSGINVFGLKINPKPGKPRVLPKGKNVDISEDGLSLVAGSDGNVEIIDGKINISRILEIKGDVGVGTGHINFSGDVKITGNIVSKYNVTAEGSIYIGGCIEASQIHAGSDIVIMQGIKGLSAQGISTCNIYANGNIASKFIENATVFANGNVLTDSILHSKVSSYESILVTGKVGSITGSKVRALKELECNIVGSSSAASGSRTELQSGITDSIKENFETLKEEVEKLSAEVDNYSKKIAELENFPNRTPIQNKKLYQYTERKNDAVHSLTVKEKEIEHLEVMFDRSDLGCIRIRKTLFAPAHININSASAVFDTNQYNCVLTDNHGEINVSPNA